MATGGQAIVYRALDEVLSRPVAQQIARSFCSSDSISPRRAPSPLHAALRKASRPGRASLRAAEGFGGLLDAQSAKIPQSHDIGLTRRNAGKFDQGVLQRQQFHRPLVI
ncbi:MAG TPA: hypothetical protein VKV17_00950 [Bryobacteraceae bacterium]|nr:hypothetical protein [Bryobacteraceae bacterium]